MSYRDLHEFIDKLDEAGELLRIKTSVSSELEITEITDRISKMPHDKNKALLFENVEGSAFPLAINLFGNPRRMALSMGVDHPNYSATKDKVGDATARSLLGDLTL